MKVTPKGIPGGGSGAYVSAFGLVITNRHCVVDALSELSTPKKDYVKNGMNAATLEEELPSGLQIHVLDQVLDVTEQVRKELGESPDLNGIRNLERLTQSRALPGRTTELVPSFGGAHFDLYIYKTYDAKLVFVPDEGLSHFGGDVDNFAYPRHTLDIAFLRAYSKGVPVKTQDWLPISEKGPADNDTVFVAGHPGSI